MRAVLTKVAFPVIALNLLLMTLPPTGARRGTSLTGCVLLRPSNASLQEAKFINMNLRWGK